MIGRRKCLARNGLEGPTKNISTGAGGLTAAPRPAACRQSKASPRTRTSWLKPPPGPPLNLQALAGPLPQPQIRNLLVHVRRGSTPPGAAAKSASTRRSVAPPPSKESSRARTSWLYPPRGAATKSASTRRSAVPPPSKESPRAHTSWQAPLHPPRRPPLNLQILDFAWLAGWLAGCGFLISKPISGGQ